MSKVLEDAAEALCIHLLVYISEYIPKTIKILHNLFVYSNILHCTYIFSDLFCEPIISAT